MAKYEGVIWFLCVAHTRELPDPTSKDSGTSVCREDGLRNPMERKQISQGLRRSLHVPHLSIEVAVWLFQWQVWAMNANIEWKVDSG